MATKGKKPHLKPLLESHYGKPISDILNDLNDGISCKEAAAIFSDAVGEIIKAPTLSWLAKDKCGFTFKGKRGRKSNPTMNNSPGTKTNTPEFIVHLTCSCCNYTKHSKLRDIDNIGLAGYKCQCGATDQVSAQFKDKDTGQEFFKGLTLLDGIFVEAFLSRGGEVVEPPITVSNKPKKKQVVT